MGGKISSEFDARRRGEVKEVKKVEEVREVEEVKKICPDFSRPTYRASSLG
jgi:hypothetical protein